jgi:hypothetical protein
VLDIVDDSVDGTMDGQGDTARGEVLDVVDDK